MKGMTTFRIPVAKSKMQIEVRILPTRKEMLAAIRGANVGGIANSTYACTVRPKNVSPRIAAIVFFTEKHIDPDIVSHEMVHAACFVLERRRVLSISLQSDGKDEEALAYLVQDFVGEFYEKLNGDMCYV